MVERSGFTQPPSEERIDTEDVEPTETGAKTPAAAEEHPRNGAPAEGDLALAENAETAAEAVTVPVEPEIYASSDWDIATKRMAMPILLVVAGLIFWISRPVIPLLIVAGILSYLLHPIVDLLERVRVPRGLSTVVLYLFLLVLMALAPILLIPVLIDQLRSLSFDVPSTARTFLGVVQSTVNQLPTTVEILGFDIPIEGFVQQLQDVVNGQVAFQILPQTAEILNYINQAISTATNLLGSTAAFGFSVVGGLFSVFLTFIFLFILSLYMTKDAPLILAYVEGLFPRSYQPEGTELLRRIGHIWEAFFRGQIILCLIVGVVTWLALSVAGMPGALILGILAGVLEIIPNLGPILAAIPAVIAALIQGSDTLPVSNFSFSLIIIGIYFVIQQLENQLLVPRIIGTSVNLHPVVVICGVVIGANIGGILGAFLAAPTIASLRIVGGYLYAKMLGYPPFVGRTWLPAKSQRKPFFYRRVVQGQDERHDA